MQWEEPRESSRKEDADDLSSLAVAHDALLDLRPTSSTQTQTVSSLQVTFRWTSPHTWSCGPPRTPCCSTRKAAA